MFYSGSLRYLKRLNYVQQITKKVEMMEDNLEMYEFNFT
jgi:hypothetical protein